MVKRNPTPMRNEIHSSFSFYCTVVGSPSPHTRLTARQSPVLPLKCLCMIQIFGIQVVQSSSLLKTMFFTCEISALSFLKQPKLWSYSTVCWRRKPLLGSSRDTRLALNSIGVRNVGIE